VTETSDDNRRAFTHERFIGFLIEHYAGNFPPWLAPEQVRVLTLNDEERLVIYAKEIIQQLRAAQVRVESDLGPDPIKSQDCRSRESARPHHARHRRPRSRVCGTGNVSVRLHSKGPQGAKPKGEVVKEIIEKIRTRAA
jgi:threonyl-tRNA synthetase